MRHNPRPDSDTGTGLESREGKIGRLNSDGKQVKQSGFASSAARAPRLIASDDTTPIHNHIQLHHRASIPRNPATLSPSYWHPAKTTCTRALTKAWKLSPSLGRLNPNNEPIGYLSLATKWRCYHCHLAASRFQLPGKDHRVNDRVCMHSTSGVDTAAFLAKSHVACKKPM